MLSPRNLLVATLLIPVLCACTAGSGMSSSNKKTTGETEDDDSETDQADEPQQVSGAFLVGCDVAADKPEVAGMVTMGCTVQEASSGKKADVESMEVTCHFKGGASEKPEMTMEPAESPWTATFALASAKHESLGSMDAKFKIGGVTHDATEVGDKLLPKLSSAKVMLAFTTSRAFQPAVKAMTEDTFTGTAHADLRCQEAAGAAKLVAPTAWKALLSATGTRPFEVLFDVQSVHAKDQTALADQFWSEGGKVFQHDEFGVQVGDDVTVWTGLSEDGTANGKGCNGWAGGGEGHYGNPFKSGIGWFSNGTVDCNLPGHLYCVLQQ